MIDRLWGLQDYSDDSLEPLQEANECVHDCVDAMHLLFAETRYLAEGQA